MKWDENIRKLQVCISCDIASFYFFVVLKCSRSSNGGCVALVVDVVIEDYSLYT
jgi:hypothetical protein